MHQVLLFKYRRDDEARDLMKRVIKVDKELNKISRSDDPSGAIYAAWNSGMESLHKLDFLQIDAATRVRALQTAGVLEPFKLIRHAQVSKPVGDLAQVPDARLFEQAMHVYFQALDARVYKRKEFFAV